MQILHAYTREGGTGLAYRQYAVNESIWQQGMRAFLVASHSMSDEILDFVTPNSIFPLPSYVRCVEHAHVKLRGNEREHAYKHTQTGYLYASLSCRR